MSSGRPYLPMWSLHQNRYLQLLQELIRAFSAVITGSIKGPEALFAPTWPLFVQLQRQGLPEQGHHALVGVGLGQRKVEVAPGVNRRQHGHPRCQLESSDRVVCTWSLPFPPPEVTHAQPGLIQVYQHFLYWILLEQLKCPLLSQDQASV